MPPVMKVLFDHPSPFALAHGGFQTQIEETKAALERQGVEVEFLRWWDERQDGALIHFFGAPSGSYLQMAREKRVPVVMTNLFTATCNRSPFQLAVQGTITRSLLALPGWGMIKNQLNWQSFRGADHLVVGLESERNVLRTVYGVPSERISTIPLGLSRDFLSAGAEDRGARQPHLITTGTITPRRRCVELAQTAIRAQVPLLFVGKPYHEADPYWKKFAALIDGRFVLHRNHVETRAEMIALLQSSRGFVIFSQYENWCLSAHEAAACGLPLLLPDMPWSQECFGRNASYLDAADTPGNVDKLRVFYDACPSLPAPALRLYGWDEVAAQLKDCYQSILQGVRPPIACS